ncbi:actin [Acrasis kona]|uniref:Actin n=1 Tax=Acrasis kona TaxID=1008807 RepID=A0AAW2ZMY1_9EUKA
MSDEHTVVIDNGTGYTKIGFAGEEAPRQIYRTVVESDVEGTAPVYPMQYGIINDWEAMEKVWNFGFKKYLGSSFNPSDHPVLIAETPLAPKLHREKITQAMFEGFETPGLFVANSCILSLYAAGRITGVVLDVGHATSKFVPIQEGFCLTHAVEKSNWGGQNVTLFLRKLLEQAQTQPINLDFEVINKIKEDLSFVDANYARTIETLRKQKTAAVGQQQQQQQANGTNGTESSEQPEQQATPTSKKKSTASQSNAVEYFKNYTLPDGNIIQIGQVERLQCNEILFQPQLLHTSFKEIMPKELRPSYHTGGYQDELDELGIQQMAFDSIMKCELDIKKELTANIILSGGAATPTGFQKRVQLELENLSPSGFSVNIAPVGSAPNSKQVATWAGGAILGQLSSFNTMWIKKSEYNEFGPQIVNRRTY